MPDNRNAAPTAGMGNPILLSHAKAHAKAALPYILQSATCPACAHHVAVTFYDGGHQPLTTLAWPKTAQEAQGMKALPLDFVRCVDCGHVFNRSFRYDQVPYSDKPNLMYNRGERWKTHLRDTIELIVSRLPKNPTVVEIGAGDGHFIKAIAQACGAGRFVAFDPNGALDNRDGAVAFYPELFLPETHLAQFKPDLIICRHMLEHLENPLGFVQGLSFGAAWHQLSPALFIEVPCIDNVFETGRTADFFYEHNSHFTTESLARMLTRAHADIELLARGYEDEVVYGYAQLGQSAASRQNAQAAVTFLSQSQARDAQVSRQLEALAQSGQTVAIWGGTGKAAAFMNRHALDARRFPCVVDSDAHKAGTHVPGTGQKIQSPQVLLKTPVEVIVIATQWRAQDIALEIRQRGIRARQLLLEYQGELVDFERGQHPYRSQPGLSPAKAAEMGNAQVL